MKPWGRKPSIKEAFDNLPAAVCFFDRNGIVLLCNRRMYQLAHAISGHDLQTRQELESWLERLPEGGTARKDGNVFLLSDGSAWRMELHSVREPEGEEYIQAIASDVSELYQKKLQLEDKIRKQREMLKSIENISHNLAVITRNEETLWLKMKIHNDLGVALNFARYYLNSGCPLGDKAEFITRQKDMLQILFHESHARENDDPLKELYHVAEGMGMKIVTEGDRGWSVEAERILSYALRECLTNTIRHAEGDTVYVKSSRQGELLCCVFWNNGRAPEQKITEGGGLSSLREKITRCGGTMRIQSFPQFRMDILLPQNVREE